MRRDQARGARSSPHQSAAPCPGLPSGVQSAPRTRQAPPAPTPLDPLSPQADKARPWAGRDVRQGALGPRRRAHRWAPYRCRCRGRGPVSLETVAQGTRQAGPWGSLRIVASISFSRMGKWWWGSASCRGRSGCCCCLLEFPGRGPVESARVKQSCRYCDLTEQVWGVGGCLVSSSALKLLLGGTHSDKLLSWGN